MAAAHEDEHAGEDHDAREGEQHIELAVTIGKVRSSEQHGRRLSRVTIPDPSRRGYMPGIGPVTSVVGAGDGLPSFVTSMMAIIPPSSWARMWQWNT